MIWSIILYLHKWEIWWEIIFWHPLVRSLGNRPSHSQCSLTKVPAKWALKSITDSAYERTGRTTAPLCMSDAKYCSSIVSLSVASLSCLNRAIREHLHKGDLCLKAQKLLLLQKGEASNVTNCMSENGFILALFSYLCRKLAKVKKYLTDVFSFYA